MKTWPVILGFLIACFATAISSASGQATYSFENMAVVEGTQASGTVAINNPGWVGGNPNRWIATPNPGGEAQTVSATQAQAYSIVYAHACCDRNIYPNSNGERELYANSYAEFNSNRNSDIHADP